LDFCFGEKQQPIFTLHQRPVKIQQGRRPEGDCHASNPTCRNPKRTKSGDQPVQDAKIGRPSAGTVEGQQLMFGKNRFCHDGADSAGPNELQNSRYEMSYEDNQMPHTEILAAPKPL